MVGGGAKKAVTGVTPVTPRQSFQSVGQRIQAETFAV